MRTFPVFAIAVGLTAGFVAPAFFPVLRGSSEAGTALRMTLEETFQRSDLVVEGTVSDSICSKDDQGVIYTEWRVNVDRTFWGVDSEERVIRMPGGVLSSGEGMVVPGMPRLTVGENVVLLLGAESATGMRMPTGLSQGKYRVITSTEGERTAVQTGEHVSLISAQRARSAQGLEMLPYADLVARLEAQRQARLAGGNAEQR